MAKPPRPWIVTRHDPLEKLEENLWTVSGDVPGLFVKRRMCIVKLANGDLIFFNAVPLEDSVLEEVKGWGRPKALIVPHNGHLIDAHSFSEKLELEVYGPDECADKITPRVKLAGGLDKAPKDASLSIETLPGVKLGEPVLTVKSGARTTLLFGDAIQNTPKETVPFMFKMMGFGGGPKVVPVFKMMFVNGKAPLRSRFEALATTPGLSRLVPSHGSIVASDAGTALRAAASSI
jgi:hypothetical protein